MSTRNIKMRSLYAHSMHYSKTHSKWNGMIKDKNISNLIEKHSTYLINTNIAEWISQNSKSNTKDKNTAHGATPKTWPEICSAQNILNPMTYTHAPNMWKFHFSFRQK